MSFKRLTALCLSILLILVVAVPAAAAPATRYVNRDYLETQAAAAYNEQGLGATYTKTATTWKVWSPPATQVQVRLYKTGSDKEAGAAILGTYPMTKNNNTGVWSLTLNGDYKNVYYTYLVNTGSGAKETRDIYAKAAGVNGHRSMVVDLDETDPAGWTQDAHVLHEEATDAVIWELHVRDFSISTSSGVSEAYRGKYLAFTESGTTLNAVDGEVSTCLNYLKEMGVNTVHLLPVYDFGSVDETVTDDPTNRNWGYDPVNYNLPEGSYSTDPYHGEVRIKEFKEMIRSLHQAGFSVVMDVVYNHTYDLDDYQWGRVLINNAFNDTVPGYYYRMEDATTWYNGSGCGNTTASDKLMFRKYMVESVKYWAEEYHVDGFRFDLMACHDVTTMNLIRSTLDGLYADGSGKQILMYGEPWSAGATGIPGEEECKRENSAQVSDRIGFFCDWMRDGIKGSADGSDTGWVQGNNGYDNEYSERIKGGITADDGRLRARSQTVTYADAHDNLILWDKILKSNGSSAWTTYNATTETYMKQLRLAETILMVSQGMQFQVAGTEFARSKKGDHNSYNSPDNINAIDWNVRKYNQAGANYYKGLIQIREAFSPITDPTNMYKGRYDNWLSDDPSLIAYWIDNATSGEWSKLVVLLNNSASAKSATLPAGQWAVICDGSKAGLRSTSTASGSYSVPAYSGVILKPAVSQSTCTHGSTYAETVTAPTCTAAGKEETYCLYCDKLLSTKVLPALGHNYQEGVCIICGQEDPYYQPAGDPCEAFTDVDRTAWYHTAVDYALENGLMNGTSATTFVPNNTMTRSMLVQVLYNLEGQPAVTGSSKFSDVKGDEWYAKAVIWASNNGVVSGYDTGKFGVEDPVTREQIASILYRYAEKKGCDMSRTADLTVFPDYESVSGWAALSVAWSVKAGFISGKADDTGTYLAPQGNAARAEVASMLMRFRENVLK